MSFSFEECFLPALGLTDAWLLVLMYAKWMDSLSREEVAGVSTLFTSYSKQLGRPILPALSSPMFSSSPVAQFLPACHCMIEFDAGGPCSLTANQSQKKNYEFGTMVGRVDNG